MGYVPLLPIAYTSVHVRTRTLDEMSPRPLARAHGQAILRL